MKKIPTMFDGYYISEDGKVWTEWTKKGDRGILREVTPLNRGTGYHGINISLKDNGKTIKQIQYYVHRLVAECLIENPNNLTDVDHIDRNKHNNHVSNLRWCSRAENMAWNAKPFIIFDTLSGNTYTGENNIQWIRENWDWISKRTKMNVTSFVKVLNYRKRASGLELHKL